MERKIKNFFENEAMPEACTQRIEAAMGERPSPNYPQIIRLRRVLTTAAILVCITVLTVSGFETMHGVGNRPLESIRLSTRNAYSLLFGLETRSREEIAAFEAENKAWEERQKEALKTPGPLAEVRDGRLYFVARNENIDITDLCSPDEVFLYTYTDEKGFIHYIGIGGTPERWGCSEVMFDTQNTNSPSNGWAGGSGRGHWNNLTDEPYGWYVQFKEQTGHIYPI